jgi:hypothetical protein
MGGGVSKSKSRVVARPQAGRAPGAIVQGERVPAAGPSSSDKQDAQELEQQEQEQLALAMALSISDGEQPEVESMVQRGADQKARQSAVQTAQREVGARAQREDDDPTELATALSDSDCAHGVSDEDAAQRDNIREVEERLEERSRREADEQDVELAKALSLSAAGPVPTRQSSNAPLLWQLCGQDATG